MLLADILLECHHSQPRQIWEGASRLHGIACAAPAQAVLPSHLMAPTSQHVSAMIYTCSQGCVARPAGTSTLCRTLISSCANVLRFGRAARAAHKAVLVTDDDLRVRVLHAVQPPTHWRSEFACARRLASRAVLLRSETEIPYVTLNPIDFCNAPQRYICSIGYIRA